jgi:hypothetical protein
VLGFFILCGVTSKEAKEAKEAADSFGSGGGPYVIPWKLPAQSNNGIILRP